MVRVEVTDGSVTVATVEIDGDVPGLFVVDVVARVTIAARRLGWTVAVPAELTETLELAGLCGELGRQPECRKQPRVQEVVQADQPPA